MIDPGPSTNDSSTTVKLDGKLGGEIFFTERFSFSGSAVFGIRFGDDTEIDLSGQFGVIFYLN